MALSPAALRSRLAMDGEAMLAIRSPHVEVVGARTVASALAVEILPAAAVRQGDASAFVVTYRFPMIDQDRRPLGEARVLFDVSSPEHPFARPRAQVVSRPVPWTPHTHPTTGVVCIGESWEQSHGTMLAAQLATHVMRLLNHDQPDRDTLDAYDWSALEYWRSRGSRPLNPGLRYPDVLDVSRPTFRAAGPVFRPAQPAFRRAS